MSSKADQPRFGGFEYVTDSGDSVPTRFDRDLARALRQLRSVRKVSWYSRSKAVEVSCTYPTPSDVIETVGKMFDERPADVEIKNTYDEGKTLIVGTDK